MLKIEHFNEDDFDKIYVFGDLHGSFELFCKMIEKIKISKNDLLIILGDSCDRGDKSVELYQKYTQMITQGYNIKHILGNHEYLLKYGYFRGKMPECSTWLNNGGEDTLRSFDRYELDPKKLQWLEAYIEQMPHALISDKSIFVHAGYDTRLDESEQDKDFLLWTRRRFWGRNLSGKAIYFGHTPNKDNHINEPSDNVYSMDVGAVFFGRLEILEIKSKTKFEVSLEKA